MPPNYRRCVVCRKTDHKSAFWRIVRLFPSRAIQLGEGMGRSAYLCPQESCLQAAQKKDRLGRSLKAPVPPEVYQQLRERLDREQVSQEKLNSSQNTPTLSDCCLPSPQAE